MPPPRITTFVPAPVPGVKSSGTASTSAISPSPRMLRKAAPNPPAWPTRVRNSRLVGMRLLRVRVAGGGLRGSHQVREAVEKLRHLRRGSDRHAKLLRPGGKRAADGNPARPEGLDDRHHLASDIHHEEIRLGR